MNLSQRPRRLRSSATLRSMVRETTLHASDFILPLFVSERITECVPVGSMPGVFQFTVDEIVAEAG
ncbi:MAG: porphobilinogen synthase, partial [Chthoniobacteraceae bacterium]